MKLNRARYVRHFAEILPWWLGFLSVWMLDYERRRIEKMLARMCREIVQLAKWSLRDPLRSPRPGEYVQVPIGAGGSIFSGFNAARSAQHQALAAQQQSNAYARLLGQYGAVNPYAQQFGQASNADLAGLFNTLYRK